MAIQQTRSAFKLTSIATRSVLNSIARFIIRLQMHSGTGTLFWVCVLFGIRSTISYSIDDESIILPKFGDRISPRTRFIEVDKLRSPTATSTTTNNNDNINTNSNSNSISSSSSNNSKFSADISAMSNLNYSANNNHNSYNHSVNSNNSNKTGATDDRDDDDDGFNLNDHGGDDATAAAAVSVRGAIDSVPNSGASDDSVSISYSTNGPSMSRQYKVHHLNYALASNGKKSAAFGNGNAERVQFDVIDSDNNGIFNALLRQHKSVNIGANFDDGSGVGGGAFSEATSIEQILCNNKSKPCPVNSSGAAAAADSDISNEIDLRNGGNSKSSAQAHRLEMSTEFFVVPSTSPSTIPFHHLAGGT